MLEPVKRVIAVLIGLPLVLAGAALLSWVALTHVSIAAIAAGGILFVIGLLFFRTASQPTYPPGVSSDGLGRLLLAGPQRVGTLLEGRIQLLKRAQPGDQFRVTLHCGRWDRGREDFRTFHEEERIVEAAPDGNAGLGLPFHFDVPATAPPSGGPGLRPYEWQLGVRRRRWYAWSPSYFDLAMDPAPDWQIEAVEAEQPAELTAEVDEISRKLGWFTGRALAPHERHRLRELPPIGRAQIRILVVIVMIFVSVNVVVLLIMLLAQALGVSL